MFSIEAAYISLTRYVMGNFPDLTWFPLWNNGEPFQSTYQPGLSLLSAAMSRLLRTDPAHGYHITIAVFYCLGPVGMFFLGYRLTGRRTTGVIAALFFSLFSPSGFVPAVNHDMGGLINPRRFQAMAFYGEGPNVSGLCVVPFALCAIYAVYQKKTALRFSLAAISAGLVAVISWPATVVLFMGTVAFLLLLDWPEIRSSLLSLAAVAFTGYLLISPLVLPSTIRDNQRNSQLIGGPYHYTAWHILYAALIVSALIGSRFAFRKFHVPTLLAFGWCWFMLPAAVAIPAYFSSVALLPQPQRFHVGMEFGAALVLASATVFLLDRLGKYRTFAIAGLCILALHQTRIHIRYVRSVEVPVNISSTYEFQFAQWLDAHAHGDRVFAPGSLQYWTNAWTDQPQGYGCCLPGLPNPVSWLFIMGAPNLDEKSSEIWLRAWGVRDLVVNGAATRDAYHAWGNPSEFEGSLPVIFQQGDDRIYRIPSPSASLAHVIHAGEVVSRQPRDGHDTGPLRPYVDALDDPSRRPASFQWISRHAARIETDLPPGDLVSIQETWSPGWRASSANRPVPIRRDGLGFLLLAPVARGRITIELRYDGGLELHLFTGLSLVAWAALAFWTLYAAKRDATAARPLLDLP